MLFNEEYKRLMSLLTERCLPPVEVLSKYKDDDNAFLSFTNFVQPRTTRDSTLDRKGTKIGLNPLSEYDTPIGVYFYPIKAYWDNLEIKDIPFAANQPHLYIVKAKNYDRLLVGSQYTREDLKRDYEELIEIFPQIDFDGLVSSIDSGYTTYPAQTFWSITRQLSFEFARKVKSRQPVIWTQILRRFYDGVVDDEGKGFIHTNEPTQAVIWTKTQFDVVDYLDRTCGGQRKNYTLRWESGNRESFEKLLKYYFVKEDLPKNVDRREFFEKFEKYLEEDTNNLAEFILNNAEILSKNIKDGRNNKLLNIIISRNNLRASFHYAQQILNFENVPDKIIDWISKSEYFMQIYLKSGGVQMSEESYLNIVKDYELLYQYLENLFINGKHPIPKYVFDYMDDYMSDKMSDSIIGLLFSSVIPKENLKHLANNKVIITNFAVKMIHISDDEIEEHYVRTAIKISESLEDPLTIPEILIHAISRINSNRIIQYMETVLIPMGVNIREIFSPKEGNGLVYDHFEDLRVQIMVDDKYVKYIAKKYFQYKNLPPEFKSAFKYSPHEKMVTFSESKNVFDYLYDKVLQESFQSQDIDMDRAYEIFNQEYLQSTGRSWSKDKFLQRARNWEFWGDQNGFVTTRSQNSGFVKLVGAAGSDKSKYKGFKELSQKNLPVWGMVDEKIRGLLKKMGYRGPNMVERLAFQGLLKSGKMDAVLGGAKLESIKGDQVTLTYPDVGTVTKYFMGSPQYWKMLHRSFLPK